MAADTQSNSLTVFSNRSVMIENYRKECRGRDALFTVDRQQDGAASAKMASRPWLLSMFCCLTTVINITFLKFSSKFTRGILIPG